MSINILLTMTASLIGLNGKQMIVQYSIQCRSSPALRSQWQIITTFIKLVSYVDQVKELFRTLGEVKLEV